MGRNHLYRRAEFYGQKKLLTSVGIKIKDDNFFARSIRHIVPARVTGICFRLRHNYRRVRNECVTDVIHVASTKGTLSEMQRIADVRRNVTATH